MEVHGEDPCASRQKARETARGFVPGQAKLQFHSGCVDAKSQDAKDELQEDQRASLSDNASAV